jgi:hypothetical protein
MGFRPHLRADTLCAGMTAGDGENVDFRGRQPGEILFTIFSTFNLPAKIQASAEKVHPGLLRARPPASMVLGGLHFQWPVAIENGGASMAPREALPFAEPP